MKNLPTLTKLQDIVVKHFDIENDNTNFIVPRLVIPLCLYREFPKGFSLIITEHELTIFEPCDESVNSNGETRKHVSINELQATNIGFKFFNAELQEIFITFDHYRKRLQEHVTSSARIEYIYNKPIFIPKETFYKLPFININEIYELFSSYNLQVVHTPKAENSCFESPKTLSHDDIIDINRKRFGIPKDLSLENLPQSTLTDFVNLTRQAPITVEKFLDVANNFKEENTFVDNAHPEGDESVFQEIKPVKNKKGKK